MSKNLLPNIMPYFHDGNGNPNVGGKVWTYQAGSQVLKDSFTDFVGGTVNANPVILDASGYPDSGGIWLTPDEPYKIGPSRRENVVKIVVGTDGYHSRTIYKKISPTTVNPFSVGLAKITDSSNPNQDSDNDGLPDDFEVNINPAMVYCPDFDNDGILDSWEIDGGHWTDYSSYGYHYNVFDDI